MTIENPKEEKDELMTFEQTAEYMGGKAKSITVNTIKKWIKQENNPLVVTELSPNKRFIKQSDLEKFLTNRIVGGNQPLEKEDEDTELGDDEDSELAKIHRDTELAEAELEKIRVETQVELAKHECDDVKQAFEKVKEQQDKLKEERDKLEKDKADYINLFNDCKKRINEANIHLTKTNILKEKSIQRFKDAVAKEIKIKEIEKLANDKISTMQNCFLYYNENIVPVIKEFDAIIKAIYMEAEAWQNNKSLWNLFQFTSIKLEILENMVENVIDVPIPEGLIPKQEENKNDN